MIPMIDIKQVRGKIGIETTPGQLDVRTRLADIQTKQIPARIETKSRPADLEVDQTRAIEALNGGKILSFHSRIYSQTPDIYLKNLAKIVERGNRMAAINNPGNPISDMAWEQYFERGTGIQVLGPASFDNVDIHFTAHKLEMDVIVGGVDIDVTTHRPEYSFKRGNVRIYMEQYPSVTITPPVIDMKY